MAVSAVSGQTAMVDTTHVGAKNPERRKPSRAVCEVSIAFILLFIVSTEALAFLYALGRLPGWELAVTVFTALVLCAGMIYTLLLISQLTDSTNAKTPERRWFAGRFL